MNEKILVIEDERPLIRAIRLKFESNNFEVHEAKTVEQALDYLQNEGDIDAIWLDHYLLGKENGLDFVAKIKNDNNWAKIPIFVVSNTASLDKVQSYMRFGVKNYYVKAEHKLEDIINDIRNFLENNE